MKWTMKLARCIYRSPSGIHVYQNFKFRWLTINSTAIQTMLHRSKPHKPALNYIPSLIFPIQNHPGNACLLGLGGAAVAHALNASLCNKPLTIVENNAEIISVAKQYFGLESLHVNVIQQDAYEFVETTCAQFQYLMVDLYGSHSFPKHCQCLSFFQHCHRILNPNGIMMTNIANVSDRKPMIGLLKSMFPHYVIMPVKKTANIVILSAKTASIEPLLKTLKVSKKVDKLYWDAEWGYIAELKR